MEKEVGTKMELEVEMVVGTEVVEEAKVECSTIPAHLEPTCLPTGREWGEGR